MAAFSRGTKKYEVRKNGSAGGDNDDNIMKHLIGITQEI